MFRNSEFEENQETQNSKRSESLSNRFAPKDRSENLIDKTQSSDQVDKKSEWVDQGIQDVPVNKINTSDTWVHGEGDFHKVSPQEFRRGFETLETNVKPALQKGFASEDFQKLDESKGIEYSKGNQRVYDAFYGQDSIRLEKIGDEYHVVNGYHRLYIAKEMGIQSVPARVIEKQF